MQDYNSTVDTFVAFMAPYAKVKSMIFVGCAATLYDAHFRALWRELSADRTSCSPTHFVLVKDDKSEGDKDRIDELVEKVGPEMFGGVQPLLTLVTYGEEYNDLAPFLTQCYHQAFPVGQA